MLTEYRSRMLALILIFFAPALVPAISYAGPGVLEGGTLEKSLPSLLLPIADCSLTATEQECCSAARCTGDVLSNRDEHNCKRKGGTSWHPAARNGNPAPCRNRL